MSKVKIYGMENCPYCEELKEIYTENGVRFDYHDIHLDEWKDDYNKIKIIAKTDKVPLIIINKMIITPDKHFNSIKEAYLLTNNILSD